MYAQDAARIAVNMLKKTQGYDDRAVVSFAVEVLKIVGYQPIRLYEKKGTGKA
jgi:hypothetical protein